jgi:hypothetical protein
VPQQVGDDAPLVITPAEIPGVLDPVHRLLMLLGDGTPIIGAMPAPASSVAPSGMLPAVSDDPIVAPELDSEKTFPAVDSPNDPGVQTPSVLDPMAADPPPSNVEPAPGPLVIPEDENPLELQLADTAGLSPPRSISVAPSGIFVPMTLLDPLELSEPRVPNGDVVRLANVLIALWARIGSQLSRIASVIINALAINILCLHIVCAYAGSGRAASASRAAQRK